MDENTDGDTWGQLLSDFGIEDSKIEKNDINEEGSIETIEQDNPKKADFAVQSQDARIDDAESEGSAESDRSVGSDRQGVSSKSKEKKSIFSRFPKISFFGVPPEVSLDSVMDGVKSPPLSGKTFTDNKMETMPLSHGKPVSQEKPLSKEKSIPSGKTNRKEKSRREESRPSPVSIAPKEIDAWSAVASQIDTLASDKGYSDKGKESNRNISKVSDTPYSKLKPSERFSERQVTSMFDDPTPESEESRTLKNIMGEHSQREDSYRDEFFGKPSDTRSRGRDRQQHSPSGAEIQDNNVEFRGEEFRRRGSQYNPPVVVDDLSDDLQDDDFDTVRDKDPREYEESRRRGQRHSKFPSAPKNRGRQVVQEDDFPEEEWSEVDAALQEADQRQRYDRGEQYEQNESSRGRRQGHDSRGYHSQGREDRQRGSRHSDEQPSHLRRRPDRRGEESADRVPSERDCYEEQDDRVVMVHHGDVPSWDDAVGGIISSNTARHRSGHSGNGRSERGRR